MWQSLKGKTNGKLSIEVTFRELEKEMGFIAKSEDLKFFFNNFNYNCDIYTLKVYLNIELDLMEPNKNRE